MKFGHLFEFLKIPDWYTEYVQYGELKNMITEFKACVKSGELEKLRGYYMINKSGQLYCIDFIKDFKNNKVPQTHLAIVAEEEEDEEDVFESPTDSKLINTKRQSNLDKSSGGQQPSSLI